jgi:hypothetical protein
MKKTIESFKAEELESRLEFKGWLNPDVTVSCSDGGISCPTSWDFN